MTDIRSEAVLDCYEGLGYRIMPRKTRNDRVKRRLWGAGSLAVAWIVFAGIIDEVADGALSLDLHSGAFVRSFVLTGLVYLVSSMLCFDIEYFRRWAAERRDAARPSEMKPSTVIAASWIVAALAGTLQGLLDADHGGSIIQTAVPALCLPAILTFALIGASKWVSCPS